MFGISEEKASYEEENEEIEFEDANDEMTEEELAEASAQLDDIC